VFVWLQKTTLRQKNQVNHHWLVSTCSHPVRPTTGSHVLFCSAFRCAYTLCLCLWFCPSVCLSSCLSVCLSSSHLNSFFSSKLHNLCAHHIISYCSSRSVEIRVNGRTIFHQGYTWLHYHVDFLPQSQIG